VSVKKTWLPRS